MCKRSRGLLGMNAVIAIIIAVIQPGAQLVDTADAVHIAKAPLLAGMGRDREQSRSRMNVNENAGSLARVRIAIGTLLARPALLNRGLTSELEPHRQSLAQIARGTELRRVVFRLVRKSDGQPVSRATVVVSSYEYEFADGSSSEHLGRDEQTERLTDQQGCCVIEVPADVSGLRVWLGKADLPHLPRRAVEREDGLPLQDGPRLGAQEVQEGMVPTVTNELVQGATNRRSG